MAYFLKLTGATAGDLAAYVNVDNVSAMMPTAQGGTRFHFTASDGKEGGPLTFIVRENIDAVLRMLPPAMTSF